MAQAAPAGLSTTELSALTHGGYVGDPICGDCHADKTTAYQQTAHARTSSAGNGEAILGSFLRGANELRTANPNLFFVMEARDNGCFQTGVMRNRSMEVLTRSERIDVVVGSGRKGQTYLFWDANQLFQLPVSYLTRADTWVNSPGYVDGRADFERPVPPRCLECHASRFDSQAPPINAYARDSLTLGISCEKCHGPGADHVARYRPGSTAQSDAGSAMINPAKLPRDRRIDGCALCHAGAGEPRTPPLSFKPGDELERHLVFAPQPAGAHIDVHASQVQLLERSRCFQASSTMSCSTCHDVHRTQRDLRTFAAKCVTCHEVKSCGDFIRDGDRITNECVTCHMPIERTEQIVIARTGRPDTQAEVRTHHIAIHPGVGLAREEN